MAKGLEVDLGKEIDSLGVTRNGENLARAGDPPPGCFWQRVCNAKKIIEIS